MKSPMHTRITQHAAKRIKPAPQPPRRSSFRYAVALLLLILLLGLGLRLWGLSHGLHEGDIYHPDSPRLIWATRHFLEGTYFFRMNNPDYDGYPYFYSHVVEYLWRGVRGVTSLFSYLVLGADRSGEALSHDRLTIVLFWLARLTNVLLSTLAIFIVYRIAARNLNPASGLLAAGLLAVSPMNVTMAHFATNDTMVCFFMTFTVLFAIRICTSGRWPDYLVAGVLVACSFSAKYHGAFVGVACLLAHLLRYWPPRKLFSREAISRMALMGLAFFITVLLANPAFLVSPGKAFHDFRKFCQYIPGARLRQGDLHLGFFGKFWLSCKLNFPVLVRSLGPVMSALALAGLVRAFLRGKRLVVLASFPASYLLLTLLTKPVQQRFYLAAIFPASFLLAAALIVELTRIKKIRVPATVVALCILFAAFFHMAKSSLTEVFFFSHRDTRRCAREWAKRNIPSFYRIKAGDYTFHPESPERPPDYRGTIFVSSSIHHVAPPKDCFPLKVFDLENDALPLFRNPRIEICAQPSSLLREGFSLPVYQRVAFQYRNDLIFANNATFYQDDKLIELGKNRPVSRIVVSTKPVESAVIVVKNGSGPGCVFVRLGGVPGTFFLGPCDVRWKELRGLRSSFPGSSSRHFYRLSASASLPGQGVPSAQLLIALTDEEKGVALYSIGEYAAAHPFLIEAVRNSGSPVLAAMAYITGRLSMSATSAEEERSLLQKASILSDDLTPETLSSSFGISLEYLNALPYLTLKPDRRSANGFHSVQDASAWADSAATPDTSVPQDRKWRIGTPPLILEPGCYTANIRLRCQPPADPDATIAVSLAERGMKATLAKSEFRAASLTNSYADLQFPFEKPSEVAECWVLIGADRYLPLYIDRIEIRPDALASLRALQRLMKSVGADPNSLPAPGPLDYTALLSLGQQRLNRDQHHEAFQYFLAAHKLRPDLADPVRRIEATNIGLGPEERKAADEIIARASEQKKTVEVREANVAFKNGVRLTGYAIRRAPFHPGDRITLSLYWSVSRKEQPPKELIAWVHFLDEKGNRTFQFDRYLFEDLVLPQKPERIVPLLGADTQIPQDVSPGKYRIEVGLWIPIRDWRPAVDSTSLPHTRYSATIGEVTVEPR